MKILSLSAKALSSYFRCNNPTAPVHCREQFAPAALGENRLVPIPLRLKLSMPRSLDRGARCDPVKKKQTLLCFWLKLKCARMDLCSKIPLAHSEKYQ